MVLKLRIGIEIRILTVESESYESAEIRRIRSVTRIFLTKVCFVAKIKQEKIDKKIICKKNTLFKHSYVYLNILTLLSIM